MRNSLPSGRLKESIATRLCPLDSRMLGATQLIQWGHDCHIRRPLSRHYRMLCRWSRRQNKTEGWPPAEDLWSTPDQLKMNPLKCAFGVTSGKFIVFSVIHRGIEIDPKGNPRDAASEEDPRVEKPTEETWLYLKVYIQPRREVSANSWRKEYPDQACQNAFDSIKNLFWKPKSSPKKRQATALIYHGVRRFLGCSPRPAQWTREGERTILNLTTWVGP